MPKGNIKAKNLAQSEGSDNDYIGWICTDSDCYWMEEGMLNKFEPCPKCGQTSIGDGDIWVFVEQDNWDKALKASNKKPSTQGAPRTGKRDVSNLKAEKQMKFGDWWKSIGKARREVLLGEHGSHGDGSVSTDDRHQGGENKAIAQIRAKYDCGVLR